MTAKTAWGMGEYARMAELLMPVAELVVERAEVALDTRLLDVACGTGNVALLAAERGAVAVGVDFEPRLLELARARSADDVEWRECDVTDMDVPSAAFDVVASVFGVIYAFDHARAVAELARVCPPRRARRRDGVDARELHAIAGRGARPVPAVEPPTRWGE